ncbi:hypothetical protein I3760_16G035600 [Carya illinoinensis]|nr:hypothetical protein I3760_16G035600 [Carya illinoinensis]
MPCQPTVPSEPTSKLDAWIALNMKQYEKASKSRAFDNILLAGLSSTPMKIIKVKEMVLEISRRLTMHKEIWDLYSATVVVESDNFMAVNIILRCFFAFPFLLQHPKKSDGQAVAMRISGDKAAFHNCKFIGFQDTLCDDQGRHLFENCYIEGTVDFIFGNGKSIYRHTTINSVAESLGVIAAQSMDDSSEDSGFVFIDCKIWGPGYVLGAHGRKTSRVSCLHSGNQIIATAGAAKNQE